MNYMITNCNYALVKDLLASHDSVISYIKKAPLGEGALVKVREGCNQEDLQGIINNGLLGRFCQNAYILTI